MIKLALPQTARAGRRLAVGLFLATLLAGGCGPENPTRTEPSLCPSCQPLTGGETGDFGGTLTLCGAVSRRVAVDRAEARALGYDVDEIERRIEQPFDAPFGWQEWPFGQAEGTGGPAHGFQGLTRVHAQLTIDSIEHYRPDPAFCDGTTCVLESDPFPQGECGHWVWLNVQGDVLTADGALRAHVVGVAYQQRRAALPGQGGETADEDQVQINTTANLRDVYGSLGLSPNESLGPHVGTLHVSLELRADTAKGSIFPSIAFTSASPARSYQPLLGSFPPRPAGPPVVTGGPKP